MNFRKYLSNARDYDVDDVLGAIGLQKRHAGDWIFPMLAGVGAGMAIGAGLVFFLTPYRGEEAREKVVKGAADAQRLLSDKVTQLSDKVSSLIGEEKDLRANQIAAGGSGFSGTGARPAQASAAQPSGGNTNRSY